MHAGNELADTRRTQPGTFTCGTYKQAHKGLTDAFYRYLWTCNLMTLAPQTRDPRPTPSSGRPVGPPSPQHHLSNVTFPPHAHSIAYNPRTRKMLEVPPHSASLHPPIPLQLGLVPAEVSPAMPCYNSFFVLKNFLRYHSWKHAAATHTAKEKMLNQATLVLTSSLRSRISCSRCCSCNISA